MRRRRELEAEPRRLRESAAADAPSAAYADDAEADAADAEMSDAAAATSDADTFIRRR